MLRVADIFAHRASQLPLAAEEDLKAVGKLNANQIVEGGLEPLVENPDEAAMMLLNWADDYLKYVDSGSSRSVYKIDKDHALKIAKDEAGVAQNRVESHIAQKFHDLPITQVHYIHPQGYFLVVDFAHQLDEQHFRETYGLSFEKFCKVTKNLSNTFPLAKQQRRGLWEELPEQAKRLIHSLVSHGIFIGDVGGSHQWGDLKDKPVLVDYGLNHQVWHEHYAMIVVARILKRKPLN